MANNLKQDAEANNCDVSFAALERNAARYVCTTKYVRACINRVRLGVVTSTMQSGLICRQRFSPTRQTGVGAYCIVALRR